MTEDYGRNRPVGEEQIMPGLLHDPGTDGKRPRPVLDGMKQGVHGTV